MRTPRERATASTLPRVLAPVSGAAVIYRAPLPEGMSADADASHGETDLPTVRVVVDFRTERHVLFNLDDDQVRDLADRVAATRAADPDADSYRLTFEFSAGQVEQTDAAFDRMAATDAADAALVDLTATEPDAAPPTTTLSLSMTTDTVDQLAEGFASHVQGGEGGKWAVEVPAISMRLLERALEKALDGAENPTDDAMAELRSER